MSEEQLQSQDQATEVKSSEGVEVNRSPEEYAARLKEVSEEAKRYRQTLADQKKEAEALRKQLESSREAELERKGNLEQLVQDLRKQKTDLEQALHETKARTAYDKIVSKVKFKAKEMGALNADDLISVMSKDLKSLPIDSENLDVDETAIADMLAKAQQSRSYMFAKPAPRVDTSLGGHSVPKDDIKQLSKEDLLRRIKS